MSKINHQEVLNSIPVPERYSHDAHTMLLYKLGVLSAWVARLANQDITVRQELRERQRRVQPGDSFRTVRRDG